MSEKKKGIVEKADAESVEGRVTAWGVRLVVPAGILREMDLSVGDEVTWKVEERDGMKVAILEKKKEEKK